MSDNYIEEFPLVGDIHYLNHAAVAPWPRRTAAAVTAFAQENMLRGATGYPAWMEVELRLRQRLARLIGATSVDDIALLKNTSEALSLVAYGIDWQPEDNVVGIHADFPSNRIVWESLATRQVEFRGIDILHSIDPEEALINACNEDTRLMAVSSVHFATGLRLDLEKLGDYCHANNILFCVDAIQSLGVVPFDLATIKADFVAADGHKWMLGPEGVALFYCNPRLRPQLNLFQYGWHMLESPGDYQNLDWHPSHTATRFESGSPNMLGIHGLEASLSLLEEVGMERVLEDTHENIFYLVELLKCTEGVDILSDTSRSTRLAGILTVDVPGKDNSEIHKQLMQAGVICAERGKGIRFSPHFHTRKSTLEQAVDIFRQIIHK